MGAESPAGGSPGDAVATDPAARGALYGILARCFEHPDERLHGAFEDGSLATEVEDLLDRTALDVEAPPLRTDDDRELLAARYNDLFVVGFSRYTDRTDGSMESHGPPVSLYESAYREDVSWSDVNLDLARAYDYFGLEIDTEDRDHHDFLPLQLEFAAYLCRREAAVDASAAAARLDFHDRHLRRIVPGVAERIDEEPGTDVYGDLAVLLERLVEADVADLSERVGEGG